MRRKPIDELVHETLFPRPKSSDPQNFQGFLTRHLIYEVRQEVHSFYGHIDDLESKYPGLDYCHATHRIRLSRWQWHRRLFRAFDLLKLTEAEIYSLTKWEGTKWAKERYEREQGITIRDTTADGFQDWVEPEERVTASPSQSELEEADEEEDNQEEEEEEEITQDSQQPQTVSGRTTTAAVASLVGEDDDESEDELLQQSVGVELNERLRERVAAHNAGDTSQPLDEEWEQWLKNAMETGEFPLVADQIFRVSSTDDEPAPVALERILPPRMLSAARAGQWHDVPDFMHDMIRRSLEREEQVRRRQPQLQPHQQQEARQLASSRVSNSSSAAVSASSSSSLSGSNATPAASESRVNASWRRTFSDLRLPDTRGNSSLLVRPAAQAPGA